MIKLDRDILVLAVNNMAKVALGLKNTLLYNYILKAFGWKKWFHLFSFVTHELF